jgi:biotin transport system substrate-specific component
MEALSVLKKEIVVNKSVCRFLTVLTFVILIGLGAFVRLPLPFTPVPVTLQTFFVLLSSSLLGFNLSIITQFTYIALGQTGLPLFAGSGVFTAGYLFGFILASIFIASLIKYTKKRFFYVFAVFILGDILILSCGSIWLMLFLGISLSKALFLGFLPFILGDLFKSFAATFIYLNLRSRVSEVL